MVFLLLKSATPACRTGGQQKSNQGDTAWLIIITILSEWHCSLRPEQTSNIAYFAKLWIISYLVTI
jgi:hypothetical protein